MPGMTMPASSWHWTAGLRTEAANVVRDGASSSYQGVAPSLSVTAGALTVSIRVPMYRLTQSTGTQLGLGDVAVEAWLALWKKHRITFGIGLPVGLPSGNASQGLGMGNVMVMPTAYTTWHGDVVDASASVSYNAVLGMMGMSMNSDSSNTMPADLGSLVNPMTMSELGASTRIGLHVAPSLRLVTEAALAVPLVARAEDRVVVGGGFDVVVGRVDVTAMFDAGVAGDPFGLRGVVELGARF